MTYNKQLETIYNWYWGNVTGLYSAWEEFLEIEYYSKSNVKTPKKEIFFYKMFVTTILNEEEENLKNYTCLPTLLAFLQVEGQSYIKKCKNLKSEQRDDTIFPKLLKIYFQKRQKIGWKKFEKDYITKWQDLGSSFDEF
jgi:hypothetical protein